MNRWWGRALPFCNQICDGVQKHHHSTCLCLLTSEIRLVFTISSLNYGQYFRQACRLTCKSQENCVRATRNTSEIHTIKIDHFHIFGDSLFDWEWKHLLLAENELFCVYKVTLHYILC